MIGGNQSPFRLGCSGSSTGPKYFLGFFPRKLAAEVPAFGNSTQMLDHCGNTVTAHERKYQTDTCGNDICAPNCSDCPGGTDLVTNTPEPSALSANTWEENGTVQLDVPRKLGFKAVQAFKYWHGDFGFSYDSGGSACDGSAKSNTKYRTKTMFAKYIDISGVIYTRKRTVTIDRHSGTATLVECEDTSSDGSAAPPFMADDSTSSPRCSSDAPSAASALSSCDPETVSTGASGSHGTKTETIGEEDVITLEITSTRSDSAYSWVIDTRGGDVPAPLTHYEGSFSLSDAYTINDVKADAEDQAARWSLTADLEYPYRIDTHTIVAPLVIRNELPGASPSIFPLCSVDDLSNPIDDAGGHPPFDPDWVQTWGQRAWFDPSAYVWKYNPPANATEAAANELIRIIDGALIGEPLATGYGQPVGGHPRGVFDKDHENWFRRNCTLTVGWTHANESRGAFTPDFLPANTPKWTDDFQATSLFPAAFVSADLSGVYLQKWVEVKINRPGINFARPYGPDKFALDETPGYVFFIDDFTSGVVTVKNIDFTTPTSLPFTGADIVGSAVVGGFFAVASVGTNTITLGAKVYDLPADWNTPSGDGHACIGRLKYPLAPGMDFLDTTVGIGGRVAITITDGSPVQITTATPQKYLSLGATPESIDILDASMTPLATAVPLMRVDETHFTAPTDFATIATAKWMVPRVLNDGSTSGQKYKFADTMSKGDYVYRTWLIRTGDETVLATTQQDACLSFNPCAGPAVAGITPNAESLASGHFWPFPNSINNGEIWLGQIQFWMTDPFWQEPHKPVAVPGALGTEFNSAVDIILWSEDNGSCQADFVETGTGGENIFHLYYPMRPYVEARCALPENIGGETPPALASGADLTAITIPPAQAHIGDIEAPLVNAIILPMPSWSKYLAQRGCVQSTGRFASAYEANGTAA